jgi:hypothetical protein
VFVFPCETRHAFKCALHFVLVGDQTVSRALKGLTPTGAQLSSAVVVRARGGGDSMKGPEGGDSMKERSGARPSLSVGRQTNKRSRTARARVVGRKGKQPALRAGSVHYETDTSWVLVTGLLDQERRQVEGRIRHKPSINKGARRSGAH